MSPWKRKMVRRPGLSPRDSNGFNVDRPIWVGHHAAALGDAEFAAVFGRALPSAPIRIRPKPGAYGPASP